jgi:hypothetical protein
MNDVRSALDLGPKLWAWVRIAVIVATAAGMWVGVTAKVNAALEEAEEAKVQLAKTQAEMKEDLRQIRNTLGQLQLDTAALCAQAFGAEKCYTAGRGR